MASRNMALAPQAVKISVALEPAYAMIDSLGMVDYVADFPGLDNWLVELPSKLSPTRLHNNRLVFEGLGGVFYGWDESWPDLLVLADFLQAQDAIELRNRVIQHSCEYEIADQTAPTIEELLHSADHYVDHIERYYQAKDKPIDRQFYYEVHALLHDPAAAQALVVFHLRDMWHAVVAEEWERVRPAMQASIEALQKLDFSGMGVIEAARIVTGRDLTPHFGDILEKASHVVFTPTPHMGPYVGIFRGSNLTRVMFRPRLPDGTKSKSPELDRSDLMVRLSALADDTRLRILELFTQHEELCAPDVIALLHLSQSAASRHLRQLTATGYLIERRREVTKCYSLNRLRVQDTIKSLEKFLLE